MIGMVRFATGLVGVFIVFLLFSGCVQQTSLPSADDIREILQRAQNNGPVYYEIESRSFTNNSTTTSFSSKATSQRWENGTYAKRTTNTTATTNGEQTNYSTSIIIRPEGMYVYNPAQRDYKKYEQILYQSLAQLATSLEHNDQVIIIGTEIIDGKQTTIIQNSTTLVGNTSYVNTYWIWNDKGVPLKVRSIIQGGEWKTETTELYRNYVFASIPDTMFDVSSK
jgi:apolipoprotein N-acyltransferase